MELPTGPISHPWHLYFLKNHSPHLLYNYLLCWFLMTVFTWKRDKINETALRQNSAIAIDHAILQKRLSGKISICFITDCLLYVSVKSCNVDIHGLLNILSPCMYITSCFNVPSTNQPTLMSHVQQNLHMTYTQTCCANTLNSTRILFIYCLPLISLKPCKNQT